MSQDDFDADKTNAHQHEHGHEHEVEEALEEALELDTQSQIFLEMRRQNLDLLKIATQVADAKPGLKLAAFVRPVTMPAACEPCTTRVTATVAGLPTAPGELITTPAI